jgi:hypothetical protein
MNVIMMAGFWNINKQGVWGKWLQVCDREALQTQVGSLAIFRLFLDLACFICVRDS